MSYVINSAAQGTPEWLSARAGLISGSRAYLARKVGMLTGQQAVYVAAIKAGADEKSACISAGYKKAPTAAAVAQALAGMPVGEWGEESKKFAFRVAVERITGQPLDEGWSSENFFSKRGKRLEEEARMLFELRHDCLVTEVGLIHTEDRKFGASADGWIDDDTGVEIKAFVDPAKLMPMLLDLDFDGIRPQVLMNLWLSGRKRWHQILYVPALECIGRDLTVCTIDRRDDGVEAEIEQLEQDLMALDELVESYRTRLLAGSAPAEILGGELEPVESDSTLVMACDVGDVARASVPASDPPLSDGEPMTDEHERLEDERLAEMTADAPKPEDDDPTEGRPYTGAAPGMLQDDCRGLSQALAGTPDAMVHARDAVADILAQQDEPATLKGGDIAARLGFVLQADFIARELGLPWRATNKSAKLWRESDWQHIKVALVKHIEGLA